MSLKRSLDADAGQIRREARIGAGLLHPNVVTVFDTVTDDVDARWLVTEYLAARSLEELVDDGGPLPEDRVRRIGAQLAAALAAMHARGIVHRDVKPGNVLVTEDDVAKLTDLGIARWTEVTRTGGAQLTGTLGYVAPEVAAWWRGRSRIRRLLPGRHPLRRGRGPVAVGVGRGRPVRADAPRRRWAARPGRARGASSARSSTR